MSTAYISLDERNCWTLYEGDGTETEPTPLVTGAPFEPGDDIRQAVAALENWARQNGYRLIVPHYALIDASLQDLIEPEIYEQVFGSYSED